MGSQWWGGNLFTFLSASFLTSKESTSSSCERLQWPPPDPPTKRSRYPLSILQRKLQHPKNIRPHKNQTNHCQEGLSPWIPLYLSYPFCHPSCPARGVQAASTATARTFSRARTFSFSFSFFLSCKTGSCFVCFLGRRMVHKTNQNSKVHKPCHLTTAQFPAFLSSLPFFLSCKVVCCRTDADFPWTTPYSAKKQFTQ